MQAPIPGKTAESRVIRKTSRTPGIVPHRGNRVRPDGVIGDLDYLALFLRYGARIAGVPGIDQMTRYAGEREVPVRRASQARADMDRCGRVLRIISFVTSCSIEART